ncbi:MAG: hypothetical protein NVSMB46_02280 [Candidatus Saccharimonadales bacterium]
MKIRHQQSGFAAVEAVVLVVVVAVVAIAGLKIYGLRKSSSSLVPTPVVAKTVPSIANNVMPAPQIKVTSDLDGAQKVLDQDDPGISNNADKSQLDSQLSSF